jgi:hypothetical protein
MEKEPESVDPLLLGIRRRNLIQRQTRKIGAPPSTSDVV